MKNGIIILSGLSCSGKTTLAQWLLDNDKNFTRVITYTTRGIRENEVNGIHYHFISRVKFLGKVENREFLEFSEVYNNLYGTALNSFDKINEGKLVLEVIDVQGAMKLKANGVQGCYIFLKASKKDLKTRMKKRGDSEEDIELRLKISNEELNYETQFDFIYNTSGNEKKIEKDAKALLKFIKNY